MHLQAPYAGAVVDETAQAEPPGLALLAELRASLLERCSLAAHEVVAPEGVPFSRVRAGCEQALEALERSLRDPHRAPFSSLVLEREVAGCIQGGLSFVSLVGALQRAFVELGTQVAGAPLEAAEAVLGAAGGVLERVSTAAAAELDTTHRASLRRRAAIADRVRAAASLLAGVALDLDRVLDAISRATAEGLACDWAAVAVREPDGRLMIAASTGRGAGWVQRWHLRADGGFAGRALTSEGAAIASEPSDIPFEGDGGPPRCWPSRCATPIARASRSCSAGATPARRSRPRIWRWPTASRRSRAGLSRPLTPRWEHVACRPSSPRSTRRPRPRARATTRVLLRCSRASRPSWLAPTPCSCASSTLPVASSSRVRCTSMPPRWKPS